MTSANTYDKKKQDTAEKALSQLLVHLGENNGKLMIPFEGRQIPFNSRLEAQYRRELKMRLKEHSKKKGKKRQGEDGDTSIVNDIFIRVSDSIKDSFEMSPKFRQLVLEKVRPLLESMPGISKRSFMPTPITFLDDAFVNFFQSIDLDLLAHTFASESAGVRSEVVKVNREILDFIVRERVCASTVLHAILSHYITVHGLRNNGDMHKGTIRLDEPLMELFRAPMESSYGGRSLADHYVAAVKKAEPGVMQLAVYRQENPDKSAADFSVDKNPKAEAAYDNGLMLGQALLIVINSHLIPHRTLVSAGVMSESDACGTIDDSKNINRLLAIQIFIKLTNAKSTETHDAPASVATARSPPRTASRAVSRSPSRTPSRVVSKSPSPTATRRVTASRR